MRHHAARANDRARANRHAAANCSICTNPYNSLVKQVIMSDRADEPEQKRLHQGHTRPQKAVQMHTADFAHGNKIEHRQKARACI